MRAQKNKSSAVSQRERAADRIHLNRWHGFFLIVGMALMGLFQWANTAFKSHPREAGTNANAAAPASQITGRHGTNAPWGELEYVQLPLEQPSELLPDEAAPARPTRWLFAGYTPERLAGLFHSLELSAEHTTALLDAGRLETTADGCVVTPPASVLFGLNRPARQRLYEILAQSPVNIPYRFPFRFQPDVFNDMLAGSGLPPDKIDLVHRLTYTHDAYLCFADVDAVRREFAPHESRSLLESLYSVPTILMRLRVKPDSDIDALVRYWGQGGQARLVRPLLESLTRIPGGTDINISLLLPPFARTRLYSYSQPATNAAALEPDCFWTSLNFFNEQPDPRFFDPVFKSDTLKAKYDSTQEPPAFGDLITLVDDRNLAVHMCVYVADDVVFTKNGSNPQQPWVLMKIPVMMAGYPHTQPLRMLVYRAL